MAGRVLAHYICIIARAHIEAAKFPGFSIEASDNTPWVFDIRYSNPDFDRLNVPIDDLEEAVTNMVIELQARYGEQREGFPI